MTSSFATTTTQENCFGDYSCNALRISFRRPRAVQAVVLESAKVTYDPAASQPIVIDEKQRVELIDRIRIVFEDPSLIVVDKPAGLLTVATDRERSKTVYALLRQHANNKKP